MKIYLDLEANAITNEVISIGMVTEDGDEFYSLVRPHTKLDRKIKELTHISQEEADAAPSIEEVMRAVRRFLCVATPLDKITFIHYGTSDRDYLRASQTFAECESTKCIIQYIIDKCENVDKRVPKHFGRKSIGLRSAYLTMRLSSNEPAIQNHNALEDAQMLKYVWENIDNYQLPEGVEIVKVQRPKMSYGKGSGNENNSKRRPDTIITGKNSKSRRNQAVEAIPDINDPKYRIRIRAKAGSKTSEYCEIYAAVHLVHRKKRKTAQQVFDAMNRIYQALDTGKGVGNWRFERV